jgi:leucyl/phenylalanyl-tRNA--protein transferase
MPVYWLSQAPVFPDPRESGVEDLVAVGGDLGSRRLVQAYRQGIFPWYEQGSPILWWSPDPRLILEPERLYVPRRLRRLLRQGRFTPSLDLDFRGVISSCASVHLRRQHGTWILPEMITAYCRLHEQGCAHSVEVWRDGSLMGGIYGVALGRAFFGESMFHREANASKVALVILVRLLWRHGFHFMDCQQTTQHLLQFGAREVRRDTFLARLEEALADPRGEPDLRPGYLGTGDRG